MIFARTEILTHIVRGENNRSIAREIHHSRDLIRRIRRSIEKKPHELFSLRCELGAPRKVTDKLVTAKEAALSIKRTKELQRLFEKTIGPADELFDGN
jgi:hypothetical protein